MKYTKIAAIMTMLVMVLAATALSGCTSGNMSVTATPTAAPTSTPTAAPTVAPTVAPVATPTATPVATPAATPTATAVPSTLPYWKTPYPTMGPWTPGDDTYVPTPTADTGYLISSPWVDQKIMVAEPFVLTISGNVESQLRLKMSDLKSLPQKTSTWKHPSDPAKDATGTGADLNALLDSIKLNPGATSIKLVGADGKASDPITIASIRADPSAIIAFMDDGSLRSIIPSNSAGKAQMKGLVTIIVI